MDSPISRTDWEWVEVDPRDVKLDGQNPRLPGLTPDLNRSQEALRNHIIGTKSFLDLCESITSFGGLYPFEVVVLLREDQQLVAFEGNRRICACQVLLEPEKHIHDAKTLATIPRATEDALKRIEKISGFIVDDRESGAALLAHLHAFPRFMRETWHTMNRMNFVRFQLDQGVSIKELAEYFAVGEKEIVDLNEDYRILYEFRYGFEWDTNLKSYLFDSPEDRDFESFLHVVKSPAVKRHFGAPFLTGTQNLNWEDHPDISEKLLLIARHTVLAEHLGSTVVHRKHESVEKYLQRIWPIEPDSVNDQPELFTQDFPEPDHIENVDSESDPNTNEMADTGTPSTFDAADGIRPSFRKDQLFSRFACNRKDERLQEITRELRRLSVDKNGLKYFSIAFCLLLRALLEWSLIYHLERSGNFKIKTRGDRYKGLSDLVNICLQEARPSFSSDPVLEKLEAVKQNWVRELHLLAHTNSGNDSESRIVEMVGDIKPIVRFVLQEAKYEDGTQES